MISRPLAVDDAQEQRRRLLKRHSETCRNNAYVFLMEEFGSVDSVSTVKLLLYALRSGHGGFTKNGSAAIIILNGHVRAVLLKRFVVRPTLGPTTQQKRARAAISNL